MSGRDHSGPGLLRLSIAHAAVVAAMAIATAMASLTATRTAAAAGPASGFRYLRKETREASRDATLAQYTTPLELSDWWIIGPFDNTGRNKHDVVYPPELGIDLDTAYPGKAGHTARWTRIPGREWERVNLKRFDGDVANTDAIAYLYRTVDAPEDALVEFDMGSDDGLKFWLNGQKIVDADVYRGLNIDDHRVALPLRKGRNELLVKVTQGVGTWEFEMRPRMDSRILALLDYHLNKDFPNSPVLRYYQPLSVLEPEGVVLEVGGLALMPDGRPVITTRRGDVWIVEGAYDDPPFDARFLKFASGLHEPLGACWHEGGLLVVQRGELTKLIDLDGDDRADVYRTVTDQWGVSGNYHEFAFGPEFDGRGRLWVTLNVGFCDALGKSIVPWRGWAILVNADGSITPVCGGLRSPNGLGRNAAGDMFCCDNQGDWVATNKLVHLEFGDWQGHPAGDRWYEMAGFPTPRGEEDFKWPAVWFPYDRMGRSSSDILLDDTNGAFGPFGGQLFVGDQYAASVMRVDLERVDGVYQGACFPFIDGLDCGVNRLCWGRDGSLFVGMTNRGWWSRGARPWGLQRIVPTGELPFEVKTMRVRPDGFALSFTRPVDPRSAGDPASYRMASFTYEHLERYGAPEIDRKEHPIDSIDVAPDGLSVRLHVPGLHVRRVVELKLDGVRSAGGEPLLHAEAYYTVNVIPK